MNPDTLYTVANQSSTTRAQLSELDELIAKYPWFSVAHLLKAKGMMESKDADYPEQLQRASVHINNRQVLFNFLHEHSEFIETVSVDPEISEDGSFPFDDNKEGLGLVQPPANTETEEQPSAKEQEESLVPEKVEGEVAKEIDPAEVDGDLDLEHVDNDKPSANDEPQELGPEHEIIAQPIEEEIELAQKEQVDPELEKEILTVAVSRIIEKEVQDEISESEEEETIGQSVYSTEDEAELSPFALRLLRGAAKIGYGEPQHEPAPSVSIDSKKESNQNLSLGELVDTFIRTSPRITPSRAPEYSPRDLAKHSLVEDDSFVTETMAKIYAQQGKLDKARKAYKLLSLKYPEKSIYFAHQLKKLGRNK
ncbi:MAG: hypothetical protein ACI84C_000340 [Flavobacteriales bacterium]|jgi:hypothetical protein